MSSVSQLLNDIEHSPDGPRVAAIFDFDGTLIAGYSATAFVREQLKRGDLSPRQFVELMRAVTSFGLGNMGFSGLMAINAQFMRGIGEDTARRMLIHAFAGEIIERIRHAATREHRELRADKSRHGKIFISHRHAA